MKGTESTWRADAGNSRLRFTLRHLVLSQITGEVRRWQASIRIDAEEPTRSTVDAVIDAASLDTADESRDEHIRSPEFLDAAAFPEIRFRSRAVSTAGPKRFDVTGDLTIRDVTREVTLVLEDRGRSRDAAGVEHASFHANAIIDRQAFGLHWNQDLDTGGVVVGDKVNVELTVEALAAREAQVAVA